MPSTLIQKHICTSIYSTLRIRMIHHINNPNEDIPSLILLRNSSEMVLNLGLIEHGELRVIL